MIQGTTVKEGIGRWSTASDYDYLSAGGGSWYSKPLRNLRVGKGVFAYVGGARYGEIGEVMREAIPVADAKVSINGVDRPLIEQSGLSQTFRDRALSNDLDEQKVIFQVQWFAKKTVADAIRVVGLFASQETVCKLRDEHTIEVLEEASQVK